jgi:hypothetical protein
MSVDPFPELRTAQDLADPNRFILVPVPDETETPGLVRLVIERATGRRWFAKAAAVKFDPANEVIGARLAEAVTTQLATAAGHPRPQGGLWKPRAAFVCGRQDLVLIQHVVDHPNQGELLAAGVDIAGEPTLFGPDQAALGRLVKDLVDPLCLVSELLFAFLVDNDDGGNDRNWLVLSVAGRDPLKQIVVIDLGFALLGRGPQALEAASYEELLSERLRVDLPSYLQQWTAPASLWLMLRQAVSSGVVAADELAAAYDRFATAAGPALRTLELGDVDPAHTSRVRRLTTARLALLKQFRDPYLLVLSGSSP